MNKKNPAQHTQLQLKTQHNMLESLWTYLRGFRSIQVNHVYVHQKRTRRKRKKRDAANN